MNSVVGEFDVPCDCLFNSMLNVQLTIYMCSKKKQQTADIPYFRPLHHTSAIILYFQVPAGVMPII